MTVERRSFFCLRQGISSSVDRKEKLCGNGQNYAVAGVDKPYNLHYNVILGTTYP